MNDSQKTLSALRQFLSWIVLLALLATGAELFLVAHFEDAWQWVPVLLIPVAVLAQGWLVVGAQRAAVRAWQALMIIFILSGFVGLGLHWNGKMEFKRESNPSLTGAKLFWEAMQTQSPPTLAPGIMIQIGLLGLALAFRHPALPEKSGNGSMETGE